MHDHHVYVYICTEVSKNSRFFVVLYVHKESSLIRLNPFLAQGVYRLHPAKTLSMPGRYAT